ncbi:unnamed protein product [Owenia fusiformis]|uniref:Uncharacterized protein n=1 Tax=Owenia fusiformis TaxID=6347 RepID=A0A8J1TWH0_OWEFU|nr:unnamed protein product [Owenia fusiformis]
MSKLMCIVYLVQEIIVIYGQEKCPSQQVPPRDGLIWRESTGYKSAYELLGYTVDRDYQYAIVSFSDATESVTMYSDDEILRCNAGNDYLIKYRHWPNYYKTGMNLDTNIQPITLLESTQTTLVVTLTFFCNRHQNPITDCTTVNSFLASQLPTTYETTRFSETTTPETTTVIETTTPETTTVSETTTQKTSAPITPTTTPAPTTATTTVTTVATTTIPDTGCPFALQKTTSANRYGGSHVANATTEEACKLYCLITPSCEAVDFNIQRNMCYQHATNGTASSNACCNHYAKTSCLSTNTVAPTTTNATTTSMSTVTATTSATPATTREITKVIETTTQEITTLGETTTPETTTAVIDPSNLETATLSGIGSSETTVGDSMTSETELMIDSSTFETTTVSATTSLEATVDDWTTLEATSKTVGDSTTLETKTFSDFMTSETVDNSTIAETATFSTSTTSELIYSDTTTPRMTIGDSITPENSIGDSLTTETQLFNTTTPTLAVKTNADLDKIPAILFNQEEIKSAESFDIIPEEAAGAVYIGSAWMFVLIGCFLAIVLLDIGILTRDIRRGLTNIKSCVCYLYETR